MDAAWLGLIGVLVGAVVSSVVPALVEVFKRRAEEERQRQHQRREVVKGLLREAFEYSSSKQQGKAGDLELLHALTDWRAIPLERKLKKLVDDLVFDLVSQSQDKHGPILYALRVVLPAWSIGEITDESALERLGQVERPKKADKSD